MIGFSIGLLISFLVFIGFSYLSYHGMCSSGGIEYTTHFPCPFTDYFRENLLQNAFGFAVMGGVTAVIVVIAASTLIDVYIRKYKKTKSEAKK